MRLTRHAKIQLAVFTVITLIGSVIMVFDYMELPTILFGVGRYTVKVELHQAGGLYPTGNVTYRGVQAGRVDDVRLTDTGAEAVLSMDSSIRIPGPDDLTAEVHSVSAIGEQYVALVPRTGTGPPLKDHDVIRVDHTYVPPDINSLLAAANRGISAIPRDNVKTVVDEGYTAVGGLGPELSRLVNGVTNVSIDARKNLDSLVALIDDAKPVLDSQIQSSDSIQGWAAHLATVTKQLQTHDAALGGLLQKGPPAADEARALFDRLAPTLPIVLANLVSVGQVAVTYRDDIEALLVLLPAGTADSQAILVPNKDTKQDYTGANLSFNLNINLPPACETGFLPARQERAFSLQDFPDPPKGDLYCRVPQDSQLNVRGARNYPCETKPGKRAPTAAMCESDEQFVPLNDGLNWKGDPNATYTGQSVPQIRTGEAPPAGQAPPSQPGQPPSPPGLAPPPLAAVKYDPATGTYVGPDGHVYTQSNLAQGAGKERTWQQMLTPPTQH
jgi:phospholipid/cholesterol/gamma-HCH transport system substrate-binding protein